MRPILGMDKSPLAAAGWPYVLGYGLLTATAAALGLCWVALILGLLTAFITFFFRDPARQSQEPPAMVLSPADGRVVTVEEVDDPDLPGGRARLVSVFMNVFNVHVNRAPVEGEVAASVYRQGRYLNAARRDASHLNERQEIIFKTPAGRLIKVVQVAGLVARRIECRLIPGETVHRGQRFGMIRFGSRLDIYLPLEARVTVAPGQRARAGLTVIAEMD